MKNKTLKNILCSTLVGASLTLTACDNPEIEIQNVGFGGYSYINKPNVILAFYDDSGKRILGTKKDSSFDHVNSYDSNGPRIQGLYNLRTTKGSWGRHLIREVTPVNLDYTRSSLESNR